MFTGIHTMLRSGAWTAPRFRCCCALACFVKESENVVVPFQNFTGAISKANLQSGSILSTIQKRNLVTPRRLHVDAIKFNANNSKPPEFEIESSAENGGDEGKRKKMAPEPVSMGKRLKIVAVVLATWGAVYLVAKYMKGKKKLEERDEQVSQIDIGASDYELVDHNGQTRTKRDFFGKWLLLYFGFTHCPDICPEELEKMADIINLIDADKSIPELVPIFLSVDPERDTPEAVKKYIKEFHEKFIGLTGTKEQVKQAAKAFRVYFSSGPRDEDNDYIVDHTIVMYLMSPQGKFVDYYGSRGAPTNKIVESITQNMKNYSRLHGK